MFVFKMMNIYYLKGQVCLGLINKLIYKKTFKEGIRV